MPWSIFANDVECAADETIHCRSGAAVGPLRYLHAEGALDWQPYTCELVPTPPWPGAPDHWTSSHHRASLISLEHGGGNNHVESRTVVSRALETGEGVGREMYSLTVEETLQHLDAVVSIVPQPALAE